MPNILSAAFDGSRLLITTDGATVVKKYGDRCASISEVQSDGGVSHLFHENFIAPERSDASKNHDYQARFVNGGRIPTGEEQRLGKNKAPVDTSLGFQQRAVVEGLDSGQGFVGRSIVHAGLRECLNGTLWLNPCKNLKKIWLNHYLPGTSPSRISAPVSFSSVRISLLALGSFEYSPVSTRTE